MTNINSYLTGIIYIVIVHTQNTNNCPHEQMIALLPQAQCGLNAVLQLLHYIHLWVWPKLQPWDKPVAPQEFSIDLIFPWQQQQQCVQSNVSSCLIFHAATVRTHEVLLWNSLVIFEKSLAFFFRTQHYSLPGISQRHVCWHRPCKSSRCTLDESSSAFSNPYMLLQCASIASGMFT